MGIFKKILAAVDGSDTSKHALRESFKLVDADDTLTVLSVSPHFKIDRPLSDIDTINEIFKSQAAKIIAEANDIAEAEGISLTTRLEEGNIYTKIIESAEESGCELIVMGRRGMTRLERALLGSETDRVIGHFKGTTLVIPRKSLLKFDNILIATDGSKYSDNALDEAISLAKYYKGALHIVNVVSISDEFQTVVPEAADKIIDSATHYLTELKSEAERAGVNAEIYVREGEPYKVIVELASNVKAGIIIMGSHGRTGLIKIFMGSVTSRVIGHAPCPVMVVNK